jgi:hypothetical protein
VGEKDWGIPVNRLEDLGNVQSFWVRQQDSSIMPLPDRLSIIVTDPPYKDSVQYSDLAQFFRVWLRWFLPEGRLGLCFGRQCSSGDRPGWRKYQQVLGAIGPSVTVYSRPAGRLIFTFITGGRIPGRTWYHPEESWFSTGKSLYRSFRKPDFNPHPTTQSPEARFDPGAVPE